MLVDDSFWVAPEVRCIHKDKSSTVYILNVSGEYFGVFWTDKLNKERLTSDGKYNHGAILGYNEYSLSYECATKLVDRWEKDLDDNV